MKIVKLEVQGDSGKTYEITAHPKGVLYCTCPAWKFQNVPPELRTCKHIKFARRHVVPA